MKIFISHNRSDKPLARAISLELKKRGCEIWLDEEKVSIGDSLIEKIGEAINESKYFLIILSKSSVQSRWVSKELNTAVAISLSDKNIDFLPVLSENVEIPVFLKEYKYADFTVSYERGLSEIVETLFPYEIFTSYWSGNAYGKRETIIKIEKWYPLKSAEIASEIIPFIIELIRNYYKNWENDVTYERLLIKLISEVGNLTINLHDTYGSVRDGIDTINNQLAKWVIIFFQTIGILNFPKEAGLIGTYMSIKDRNRLFQSDFKCVYSDTFNEYTILENNLEATVTER